jgi:hypothetical protein
MRTPLVVRFLAVLLLLNPRLILADTCGLGAALTTWNDGNGAWSLGGNWTAGVPTGGTNACITDGTSAVTLNGAGTVANLQVGSGNSLTLNQNSQLSVSGPQVINAGQIGINGGGGTNTLLLLDGNTTLSGTGTLTMNVAGGGGSAFIQQGVGGVTLANQSTIQGAGVIGNGGLALSNSGTINANSSGQGLLLDGSGGITNTSLLEASNGGILQLDAVTVNNAGGNITANGAGASVQLFGSAVIQGGTLNNNGGAFFGTPQGNVAYLDGSTGAGAVTINGTYTSDLNTDTYLRGTINNNGNIQLNGGSGTNSELLIDSTNVTLQGGGTVTLSTAGGGGNAIIAQAVGGTTLTNVNNTIQGEGIIGVNGLTLVNQATVNANVSGQVLLLDNGAVTNTGTLEASNGGILQISGDTVNHAGGNITANAGSSVQLFGSTVIQGGTLNNNGGAFFGTPQGNVAYLDGSTAAGAVTINGTYTSDLNTDTYLRGTINNTGNFQLNGGSGTNSVLLIDSANVTLQGGGTVTLSTVGGGGNAIIAQAVGGTTLTNVNNTIQGAGIIGYNGLTLVNQATVNANVSGQALLLDSGAVTNSGTLEASNGGILQINGDTVNHAGGNITANAGSSVQLFGSTVIQGGTLNNNGGAFFGTPQGNVAYLDGSTAAGAVTINGTYTSDLNSATYVLGTINNTGNFQLNGGSGTNSVLLIDSANVTLQGGGTVTLSMVGGGGNAIIAQAVGGTTLTNVNNTIRGAGIIGLNGLSVLNDAGGTLLANAPGQTLLFNGGGTLTNHGTMQVYNSATMQISNGGFTTDGNVTIDSGGNLISDVAYNQTGGRTQVDGTLTANAGMNVSGGTVDGTGTILGDVLLSGGTMQPGDAPGTLTIIGNYDQTGGIFDELISSTANGLLVVFGDATLGPSADLNIDLLSGFVPTLGEDFTIVAFLSSSGAFANAPGGDFTMDGFNWSIAYNPHDIVLTFESSGGSAPPTVPEPSTLILLATGLAACMGVRRLNRRFHPKRTSCRA